ncbi:MAG: MazG family protein [Proteobacteria bacterium]|nr:MazG family protein [Pseudomonadota bacterium]
MQRLLGPGGCPWDQQQTLQTLRPYLLEEAYEVLEAIDAGRRDQHCEELGDLLLQIVFQAALAGIALDDVVRSIGDKLIRRHPHVFGEATVRDADEVLVNWERIKATEPGKEQRSSVLDGVPGALPALQRSHELTRKAARLGLSLRDAAAARARIERTLAQADAAMPTTDAPAKRGLAPSVSAQVAAGELLLAIADWSRLHGVEPEQALRDANNRFAQRVRAIECESRPPSNAPSNAPSTPASADQTEAAKAAAPDEASALLDRLWPS